jgi:hypothetical protein
MSPKTHSKNGRKCCYQQYSISARGNNRNGAVTRRSCFLLREGRNVNRSRRLAKVTAVTFWPTTERALALLRGSKVTCYFLGGRRCYYLLSDCDATIGNQRLFGRPNVCHCRRPPTTCQPSRMKQRLAALHGAFLHGASVPAPTEQATAAGRRA